MIDRETVFSKSQIGIYFSRLKIDINTKRISSYKTWKNIFNEIINVNFFHDYPSDEFKLFLKEVLFEIETIVITIKKLIKNNPEVIEELKKINMQVYYVINLLFTYNKLPVQNRIDDLYLNPGNFLDLYPLIKEIFSPIYFLTRISINSEDKISLRKIFPMVSNYNRTYVFYSFTKLCLVSKKEYLFDDKFITYNFGHLCESFGFLFDKCFQEFYPLICRYLGFRYMSYKKVQSGIVQNIDTLFDINGFLEEFNSLSGKIEQGNDEERDIEVDEIYQIPQTIQVSSDLISHFLHSNVFSYLKEYPDFIGFLYKSDLLKDQKYKIISNEDNIGFFIFSLKILETLITYAKKFQFKEGKEFEDVIQKLSKTVFEYENLIEVNYVKRLSEIASNIPQQNKKIETNDYIHRIYDELNSFKKQYVYKNYYYHHYTAINISDQLLTPFYQVLEEAFKVFEKYFSILDRRSHDNDEITKIFSNANSSVVHNAVNFISRSFDNLFPKMDGYHGLIQINIFYIFYHFLNLVNYFIIGNSSIFNYYPSTRFVLEEKKEKNTRIYTPVPDFYYYKKMSYQVSNLEKLAYIDPLTQCYNKNFVQEKMIAEDIFDKKKGGVLYLDLDNFKYFNDNYGHKMGDEILKYFGEILISSIRQNDFAVRAGGDEFILFLDKSNLSNNYLIAKRVMDRLKSLNQYVKELIKLEGKQGPQKIISCSIGGIMCDDDIQASVNGADKAMYQAKEKGKDMICLYSKEKGYQIFGYK